jgi:DNA-binding NarL/FixJ family response regulator
VTTHCYRVAIIEDEATTRQRIKQAVERHAELQVIADAGDCAQGRQIIETLKPDVLLVDLGLPDGHGTELITLSQSVSPQTEIMVITVFGDEKNVLSAIEAGATSYLLKDADAEHVGYSIKQMLDGGSPISASIARHLLKRFHPVVEEPAAEEVEKISLTRREREVPELVAKGFSYNEIGKMLEMSVHTVTSHIKHIYRKLSVNSRGEAVFEAAQLGLIKSINRQ